MWLGDGYNIDPLYFRFYLAGGQLTFGVLQWNDVPAVVYASNPELFEVMCTNLLHWNLLLTMIVAGQGSICGN